MDDKPKPLSDSEIQALRDEIAESEKRRWLRRLIRTVGAWIGGTLVVLLSLANGVREVVDWATKK